MLSILTIAFIIISPLAAAASLVSLEHADLQGNPPIKSFKGPTVREIEPANPPATVVNLVSLEPATAPGDSPLKTFKGPTIRENNTPSFSKNRTHSPRQEFPASFNYCPFFDCESCELVDITDPEVNRCYNVGGFRSVYVDQPSGEGFPFEFILLQDGCMGPFAILPSAVNTCYNLDLPVNEAFTCWGLVENVPGIDI